MAVTGGVKELSNLGFIYDERRDFYLEPDTVRELYPSEHPFLTLLLNKGVEEVGDPDFKMFEHRSAFINQRCVINDNSPVTWSVAGAPKDTLSGAITVDGIVGLPSTLDASVIGTVFEVYASGGTMADYKGLIYVTGVISGELTAISLGNPRSITNRVAALADNDILMAITSAHAAGITAPQANADEIEVVYNSSEITRTTLELKGDILNNARLRGGSSEIERIRREKLKEHNMKISRKILFQNRAGGTGMTDLAGDNITWSDTHGGANAHPTDASSNVVRTTMGVIPTIFRYGAASGAQQNIFQVPAASFNYGNFVENMEKIFQYNPEGGELVSLCGAGMLSYWSKVDESSGFVKKSGFSVTLENWERSELGFNFRRLITPHGNLLLVKDVSLRGPYNGSMLVVDDMELAIAQYRPTTFKANIKTDDAYDGEKDEYFSDLGVKMTMIEKHSFWYLV